MVTMTVSQFYKDMPSILNQVVTCNEQVQITTHSGNAVVVSEEEYCNLLETVAILSDSRLSQRIVEGLHTPLEDCVPENKVNW